MRAILLAAALLALAAPLLVPSVAAATGPAFDPCTAKDVVPDLRGCLQVALNGGIYVGDCMSCMGPTGLLA